MASPGDGRFAYCDRVILATWPNEHDPVNCEILTDQTGAFRQVHIFDSNEEMLAEFHACCSGWDVYAPTNYMIAIYADEGLIEPLVLSKLPNYDPAAFDLRFSDAGIVGGVVHAVPKNWGTAGCAVNTDHTGGKKMDSWKHFIDRTIDDFSGRTMAHDKQLTTIWAVLNYRGYSFNSVGQTALFCHFLRISAGNAAR